MTIQEIVTAARQEGGLDATDAQILGWVRGRLQRLYAESQYRTLELSLGSTAAGTGRYAVPQNVVDLRRITVGGVPYTACSVEELWNLKAGYSRRVGPGGLFAPGYDGAADLDMIELWPVPAEDGHPIIGLAAIVPADLELADTPGIPVEFHYLIVEGAIADGLARLDEQLPESDRWEARWGAGVEQLRRRRNTRIGSGPARIKVGRV